MQANKIFFDTYYPHPDKDDSGLVHVVLKDAKIYTVLTRRELSERNLFSGCFIECQPSETQQEAEAKALSLVRAIGARQVTPEQFAAIEREGERERVQKAFAYAEAVIRENGETKNYDYDLDATGEPCMTADEIAYEQYKRGECDYAEYVSVCDDEETEPLPPLDTDTSASHEELRYYECEFELEDPKEGTYSICIKGLRKPTPSEAEVFCASDMRLLGLHACIDVSECGPETAHSCYDMERENTFPIFR